MHAMYENVNMATWRTRCTEIDDTLILYGNPQSILWQLCIVKVDSLGLSELSSSLPNLKKEIFFLSCVTSFLLHCSLSSWSTVNVPRFCRRKKNSWLWRCKCMVAGSDAQPSSPRSLHSPRTTFISITKRFIICRYLRRIAPLWRDLTKRFLRFPMFKLFRMEC